MMMFWAYSDVEHVLPEVSLGGVCVRTTFKSLSTISKAKEKGFTL